MPSTYSPDEGFELPGHLEQSNTWDSTLNNNFQLIDNAIASVSKISLTSTTYTLLMQNSATCVARSPVLVFSGNPGGNATVTISPTTIQKWWFIRNSLSGGYTLTINAGSTGYTILNGGSSMIYTDGVGNVASMTDLLQLTSGGTSNVVPNGSASNPGLSFLGQANTGLYYGSTSIGVAIAGTGIATFGTTGLATTSIVSSGNITATSGTGIATVNHIVSGDHASGDGTAGAPGFFFSSEATTGLYRKGTQNPVLTINGSDVLSVTPTSIGFGIAAASTQANLHVQQAANTASLALTQTTSTSNNRTWRVRNTDDGAGNGQMIFEIVTSTNSIGYTGLTIAKTGFGSTPSYGYFKAAGLLQFGLISSASGLINNCYFSLSSGTGVGSRTLTINLGDGSSGTVATGI